MPRLAKRVARRGHVRSHSDTVVSRAGRAVLAAAMVAAVFAGGWMSGRAVLAPPEDPLAGEAEPVTYTVQESTVGRSLSFAAVGEWLAEPAGVNAAAGTVTSVEADPGRPTEPGDVLLTVDLRPVVAAEGMVPMFRDLRRGDSGADVEQLDRLLDALGFLSADPDSDYDADTAGAVVAWQRSLGVRADGRVRAGDLVFLPSLPARVALAPELARGARLAGGEQIVQVLAATPRFAIPLSPDQRSLVPRGAEVIVSHPGGQWLAKVDRLAELPGATEVDLILVGPDGGPVCGEDCADHVPVGERTTFTSEVILTPQTTGPTVPVAAIRTDPSNAPYVLTPQGSRLDVEVLASANGLAVVDGIDVGAVVELPFGQPPHGEEQDAA